MKLPNNEPYLLLGTANTIPLRERLVALSERDPSIWTRFAGRSALVGVNAQAQCIIPRLDGVRELLADVLDPLLAQFPAVDRVRIAKLPPGCTIPLHIDMDAFYQRRHRAHIVIQTNPDVEFVIGEASLNMREGMVYEMDNLVEHAVYNRGSDDRIHVIVDYGYEVSQ